MTSSILVRQIFGLLLLLKEMHTQKSRLLEVLFRNSLISLVESIETVSCELVLEKMAIEFPELSIEMLAVQK